MSLKYEPKYTMRKNTTYILYLVDDDTLVGLIFTGRTFTEVHTHSLTHCSTLNMTDETHRGPFTQVERGTVSD